MNATRSSISASSSARGWIKRGRSSTSVPSRVASARTDQVLAAIDSCATLGDGSVEPVARSLGLQARTLQRRLRAVDTSFHDLHERYRQAQAAKLLEESELPPKEIAHRLGYANKTGTP
jgi:AraC-like DNA-binding protein